MAASLISSICYKDISDHKGDIAVTKLKCPVALIRNRQTDFEFERHCQLFVDTDNETLAVAMLTSNGDSSPAAIDPQGHILEQAEQFENDYDNNNYSDYVEDASVHAED
jgi:hypothetical protein